MFFVFNEKNKRIKIEMGKKKTLNDDDNNYNNNKID